MTCYATFVIGALLLCFITGVLSADGLGLGYGSLFMQHNVEEKPKATSAIEGGRDIAKGVEPTSTTLKPEYKPTRDELQKIIDCYYHRQWKRTTEPLNSTQQFCKRLGTNQPNFTESNKVFRAFRFIWENLLPLVNNTENYTPTPEEIQEIEDCFFYRSWEWRSLSQLTYADLYCKRLAKNTPNSEESGWMNHFKALRQVWLSMYDVATQDSTQMQACLLKKFFNGYRPLTESCDRIYARIDNRKSHRDWRLEELYKCLGSMKHFRIISHTKCSHLMLTFYGIKFMRLNERIERNNERIPKNFRF